MIVFMQNDAGRYTIKGFFMMFELFVIIFDRYLLSTVNILPDFRNAQATFIIRPIIPMLFNYMSINKSLLDAGSIRISFFLFVFL